MYKSCVKEDTLICTFKENLDTATCTQWELDFNRLIAQAAEDKTPVVFDLQNVKYIASSFLRICTHTAKTVGTENITIINVSTHVKKVFKIASFDQFLTIT